MKNILILFVLVVVVVAFGYFTVFSDPAHELQQEADKEVKELSSDTSGVISSEQKPEPFSGQGSLQSLGLLGQDLECTIKYSNDKEGSTVEGTYFTNGGDIRGDFLTDSPDLTGQILSSMIVRKDEGVMYIWSEIEGQSYGVKTTIFPTENAKENVSPQGPVSLESEVVYDCKPWPNVDRTVFDPPANVLFRDVSELINNGMEYGTTYEELPVPELP